MARLFGNWKVYHPLPEGPADIGKRDGLSYALWLPKEPPLGGVVVIHGAGSCKESHFDFARAARGQGLAAVTYDQRGHGDSDGPLDGRMLDDVAAMAAVLPPGPVALRGSSMGGYVALLAAVGLEPAAVVAICPAHEDHLLRSMRNGRLEFAYDERALAGFLTEHSLRLAVEDLRCWLLLMHAEGDEQVPVAGTRDLEHAATRTERIRLLITPGGHHRSIQHDGELQAESLRFIEKAFRQAGDAQPAV